MIRNVLISALSKMQMSFCFDFLTGESCFLCGVASLFGLPLIIFGALHRQKLRELKGIDGKK